MKSEKRTLRGEEKGRGGGVIITKNISRALIWFIVLTEYRLRVNETETGGVKRVYYKQKSNPYFRKSDESFHNCWPKKLKSAHGQ